MKKRKKGSENDQLTGTGHFQSFFFHFHIFLKKKLQNEQLN